MLDVNMLKENADDVKRYKQKEEEFIRLGNFNADVDEIPADSYYPVDENFRFIKKGFKNFVKHKFYLSLVKKYTKLVNRNLTNLKIEGKENLRGIKGAIVTCNHVSKCDSFAVREAVGIDIMYVANETNNWKSPLGTIGRQTGYLPLTSNLNKTLLRKFNEAMEYYIEKKHKKVLIYPEQAMWREEARPRPIKNGAFHYAVKHNVPVIPLFITFTPKEKMVDKQNRREFSDYTIHILPPIYKKDNLSDKENINYMRDENAKLWKETYETTYNKKLKF